jgi:hypothetical protein
MMHDKKTKMAADGGIIKKGYAAGGAMPMVEKDSSKQNPMAFGAGMAKTKMAAGGMA